MKKYNLFWVIFLIFLLTSSIFPVFKIIAATYEKRAAENWTKTFGPIEDLPKRYPFRNDNEAAVKLKLLAIQLGIEFTVPGESQHFSPSYQDAKRFQLLGGRDGLLASYIRRQLERPDETVDCPSNPLASYLFDNESKIEAVRNHILISPSIVWQQNLDAWDDEHVPDATLPRLLGILELQKVLVAHALELTASRRYPEAESYLEVGWKLNESLKIRPELISQLVALTSDQRLLGLVRKLPGGTDWIQKISKHDYRKAFVSGYMVEAWLMWRLRNDALISDSPILNSALDPYFRFCVASHIENERQEIQHIQTLTPCSLRYEDFWEEQPASFWEWNKIEKTFLQQNKNLIYGKIKKIEIDRELTAKIIQVKHGYFPPEGSEWSTSCNHGVWIYRTLPNGSTSIEYASPLELPTVARPVLPTSFVVTR